jgi:hypothetical protein
MTVSEILNPSHENQDFVAPTNLKVERPEEEVVEVDKLWGRIKNAVAESANRAYEGMVNLPKSYQGYVEKRSREYRLGVLGLPETDLGHEREMRLSREGNLLDRLRHEQQQWPLDKEKIQNIETKLTNVREELAEIDRIDEARFPAQEAIADRIDPDTL